MPASTSSILIKRANVRCVFYGGLDWKTAGSENTTEGEAPPAGRRGGSTGSGGSRSRGGIGPITKGRDINQFVDLDVRGLCVTVDDYGPAEQYSMRILLLVRQLDILDRIQSSAINKLLTDYRTQARPRETVSNMIRTEMIFVKTPGMAENDGAEELILHVDLLPLRLNIDQDTLNFLVAFLTEDVVGEAVVTATVPTTTQEPDTTHTAPSLVTPAMAADIDDMTATVTAHDGTAVATASPAVAAASSTTRSLFIKRCVVNPIYCRIDYQPKRVVYGELLRGNFSQLSGVLSLSDATLDLPRVEIRGAEGFARAAAALQAQYLLAITKGQVSH